MPTYKEKLIEMALPKEEINAASAREKSIGTPAPCTCGGRGVLWRPAGRRQFENLDQVHLKYDATESLNW